MTDQFCCWVCQSARVFQAQALSPTNWLASNSHRPQRVGRHAGLCQKVLTARCTFLIWRERALARKSNCAKSQSEDMAASQC